MRFRTSSIALTACLAAGGLASAAPPRIERGDPAISGAFLRPYTNQWKFSIRKPGGESVEAGVWRDALEATTFSGQAALKRTQVAEYKSGTRLTFVNVFDPATMASLSFDYTRSDTGETRHLEIRDRVVSFRRFPGTGDEPAQDYTAKVDAGILDFYDGLYGILLDTLPLREGYDVSLPAFDTDRAAIDWVHLKVMGRETVEAGEGETREAWVVHVDSRLYESSTWWLTREAPFVIKAVLVLPEREGGATITYTMV